MVYLSSNFWLLAVELYDLSQAEKKITVVKDEKIHKMTRIFTQNGQSCMYNPFVKSARKE